MCSKYILWTLVIAVLVMTAQPVIGRMSPGSSAGREIGERAVSSSTPAQAIVAHRIGKMVLGINNNGTFGNNYSRGGGMDFFTHEIVPSCEYPKGSRTQYLYGAAFWIGAVIGRDTLVSVGADGWSSTYELNPDVDEFGEIVKRSILDPSLGDTEEAVSEEDYVAVYTDTLIESNTFDEWSGRLHRPLNIEITEASYAWSYPYADDIVLFDFKVKNIGQQQLKDVYMGIYVDADIHIQGSDGGAQDDLSGFIETWPSTYLDRCIFEDTVFIAWTADNDGDMHAGAESDPVLNVTATRIIRTPAQEMKVSYNWWVGNGNGALDYGPREKPFVGRLKESFRNYGTGGMGTPEGDANKYYVMRNQEFDFDQARVAEIRATDTLWLAPSAAVVDNLATGLDTRYLLSFGAFEIDPGETLPVSFAYIGGENWHTEPNNAFTNLPHDPDLYYSKINRTSLAQNARWAGWIYDNPGVDTDGDGDAGVFFECWVDPADHSLGADTVYVRGDGVPDFKGASPPPSPSVTPGLWITPSVCKLNIRFNGMFSETAIDVFSRTMDFEGYRVYVARDERNSSYSLVASYDKEDYNKWVEDGNQWVLYEEPFTLDSLSSLYADGDPDFNPLDYTRSAPMSGPGDSVFAFEMQDFNASVFGVSTDICKRFPNQPRPGSLDPADALPGELTEDGYYKYYEYEYEITDLLPSVEYWVNVTAFDYGSPRSGLLSLESSRTVGSVAAYPLASADEVTEKDLKAYVYPNPYRLDAEYRGMGLEGRGYIDRAQDRVRTVHFANLPAKCTISIFSLDGDLVREISHDVDKSNPEASHDFWDLITRNTQLAVSGMYYWTVEGADGEVQIGKLVLIM